MDTGSTGGRILGLLTFILGLIVALGPHYLFPVCKYFDLRFELNGIVMPMFCWYTSMAELGVGLIVIVVGLILFMARSDETRVALGIILGALGIITAIMPTYLIPVCIDPWHPCHIATRPALIIIGIVMLLVAIITIVSGRRTFQH